MELLDATDVNSIGVTQDDTVTGVFDDTVTATVAVVRLAMRVARHFPTVVRVFPMLLTTTLGCSVEKVFESSSK